MPKETAQAIARISDKPRPGDNVGLWLDKLVLRRPGAWTIDKDDRRRALERLCGTWRSEVGAAAVIRHEIALRALHAESEYAPPFQGSVDGRLLVDYGRATATEVSVSFHPIWGVPRIPGSALKGIVRAQMLAERADPRDVDALLGPAPERSDKEPAERGRIVFYDALPVDGAFKLSLDVLTPHHRSYYDGHGPPAEWEDPVPVTFLTVVATQFVFSLGALPRGPEDVWLPSAQEDLQRVGDQLKCALAEAGVGAKTGAGYGRFLFSET